MYHLHSCSISTFATFPFLNVYFRIFLHPDGSHENGAKEGSPHPTVSQQPALSSQQSPRTLLSTESDTAYVTGLGYDGTSSPSSPASFDGSAVLQNSGAVGDSVLLAAGELPSSGVT